MAKLFDSEAKASVLAAKDLSGGQSTPGSSKTPSRTPKPKSVPELNHSFRVTEVISCILAETCFLEERNNLAMKSSYLHLLVFLRSTISITFIPEQP